MRKRIQYSQNFLKDKNLIKILLEKSTIQTGDLIYEIGSGQGVITDELLKKNTNVVSFEIDSNLYNKLVDRYKHNPSINLVLGDFLVSTLPSEQYKVFSNIPFNITSAIIKKLTFTKNTPVIAYLIIQKDAAKKFIGKPLDKNNSLLSVLIKTHFDLSIFHEFRRTDFFPKPSVDVVMLNLQKRITPHIPNKDTQTFYDFVTFVFSQFEPNILQGLRKIMPEQKIVELAKQYSFSTSSKPSELEFNHWLMLFQTFLNFSNSTQKQKILGSFNKLQEQQQNLQKIHRTRLDRNWRKT